MKVHFNTKINSIDCYHSSEYNRSTVNLYVKKLIRDCYEFESMIARMVNCKSQYIILTNYDGEYDIRVSNFTKGWYEDISAKHLFTIIQQFNQIDHFIDCFDYHVSKNINNDIVPRIEFKYYALLIKIGNIYCMDE